MTDHFGATDRVADTLTALRADTDRLALPDSGSVRRRGEQRTRNQVVGSIPGRRGAGRRCARRRWARSPAPTSDRSGPPRPGHRPPRRSPSPSPHRSRSPRSRCSTPPTSRPSPAPPAAGAARRGCGGPAVPAVPAAARRGWERRGDRRARSSTPTWTPTASRARAALRTTVAAAEAAVTELRADLRRLQRGRSGRGLLGRPSGPQQPVADRGFQLSPVQRTGRRRRCPTSRSASPVRPTSSSSCS